MSTWLGQIFGQTLFWIFPKQWILMPVNLWIQIGWKSALADFRLLSLHNHVSQFLIINNKSLIFLFALTLEQHNVEVGSWKSTYQSSVSLVLYLCIQTTMDCTVFMHSCIYWKKSMPHWACEIQTSVVQGLAVHM